MNRDTNDCVVSYFTDTAAVHPCNAKKMGHRNQISCKNHNLNLEGNLMVESNAELNETCKKIRGTSATVRNSCKVSVDLSNEASLDKPRLTNIRTKGKCITCQ